MLQSINFRGVDLSTLSLETLEGMADATEAFIFSQQQPGEKFHPDYRKNRKSFKKLIRETVKFKREVGKFFASQYQRITPYIYARTGTCLFCIRSLLCTAREHCMGCLFSGECGHLYRRVSPCECRFCAGRAVG